MPNIFILSISLLLAGCGVNPLNRWLIEDKYPGAERLAVMDVVNAEMQFSATGVNPFLKRYSDEGAALDVTLEPEFIPRCGDNCLRIRAIRNLDRLDEIRLLLERPCVAKVLSEPNLRSGQPKNAALPVSVTALLITCDNRVERIGYDSFILRPGGEKGV